VTAKEGGIGKALSRELKTDAARDGGGIPLSARLSYILEHPGETIVIQGITFPAAYEFTLGWLEERDRVAEFFKIHPRAKDVFLSEGAKKTALKDIRWMRKQLLRKGQTRQGRYFVDHVAQVEGKELLPFLRVPDDATVIVDLGGGTGGLMSVLARSNPIARKGKLIVVDNDEYEIEWGRRLRSEEDLPIEFLHRSALDTRLPAGSVDLLISKQLISVFQEENPEAAIGHFVEANRILKRGGLYYTIDDIGVVPFTKAHASRHGFQFVMQIPAEGLLSNPQYAVLLWKKVADLPDSGAVYPPKPIKDGRRRARDGGRRGEPDRYPGDTQMEALIKKHKANTYRIAEALGVAQTSASNYIHRWIDVHPEASERVRLRRWISDLREEEREARDGGGLLTKRLVSFFAGSWTNYIKALKDNKDVAEASRTLEHAAGDTSHETRELVEQLIRYSSQLDEPDIREKLFQMWDFYNQHVLIPNNLYGILPIGYDDEKNWYFYGSILYKIEYQEIHRINDKKKVEVLFGRRFSNPTEAKIPQAGHSLDEIPVVFIDIDQTQETVSAFRDTLEGNLVPYGIPEVAEWIRNTYRDWNDEQILEEVKNNTVIHELAHQAFNEMKYRYIREDGFGISPKVWRQMQLYESDLIEQEVGAYLVEMALIRDPVSVLEILIQPFVEGRPEKESYVGQYLFNRLSGKKVGDPWVERGKRDDIIRLFTDLTASPLLGQRADQILREDFSNFNLPTFVKLDDQDDAAQDGAARQEALERGRTFIRDFREKTKAPQEIKEGGRWVYPVPDEVWDTLTEDDIILLPYLYEIQLEYGRLFVTQNQPKGGTLDFPITAEFIKKNQDPRHIHDEYATAEGIYEGRKYEIPYSIVYAEGLGRIAALLEEAENLIEDPDTKEYLRANRDAALWNTWEARDHVWMKTYTRAREEGRLPLGGSRLRYFFGPYEAQIGKRGAFKAVIGIIDPVLSEEASRIDSLLPWYLEKHGFPQKGRETTMHTFAIYVPFVSGNKAAASTLPNYASAKEAWGQSVHHSISVIHGAHDEFAFPMAQQILDSSQLKYVSIPGALRFIMLHEFSHGAVLLSEQRRKALQDTLDEERTSYFYIINELNADLSFYKGIENFRELWPSPNDRREILTRFFIGSFIALYTTLSGKSEFNRRYLSERTTTLQYLIQEGLIRFDEERFHLVYETDSELERFEEAIRRFSKEIFAVLLKGDIQEVEKYIGDPKRYEIYRPILDKIFDSQNITPENRQEYWRRFEHLVREGDFKNYVEGPQSAADGAARDGGDKQPVQWVDVNSIFSSKPRSFQLTVTTQERAMLEKSLFRSLRSAGQLIELGPGIQRKLYRLVRKGGYRGPYFAIDLQYLPPFEEDGGYFSPIEGDIFDRNFMNNLILRGETPTVILSDSALWLLSDPGPHGTLREKVRKWVLSKKPYKVLIRELADLLSHYPADLQIHRGPTGAKDDQLKQMMVNRGWTTIELKGEKGLMIWIFLRPNGKVSSDVAEFLTHLKQDRRFTEDDAARDGGEKKWPTYLSPHPTEEELMRASVSYELEDELYSGKTQEILRDNAARFGGFNLLEIKPESLQRLLSTKRPIDQRKIDALSIAYQQGVRLQPTVIEGVSSSGELIFLDGNVRAYHAVANRLPLYAYVGNSILKEVKRALQGLPPTGQKPGGASFRCKEGEAFRIGDLRLQVSRLGKEEITLHVEREGQPVTDLHIPLRKLWDSRSKDLKAEGRDGRAHPFRIWAEWISDKQAYLLVQARRKVSVDREEIYLRQRDDSETARDGGELVLQADAFARKWRSVDPTLERIVSISLGGAIYDVTTHGFDLSNLTFQGGPKGDHWPLEYTIDSEALESIFGNLIYNALHAMAESQNRILTVETGNEGGYLFVRISDTGHGISPEALSRIWSYAFTKKPTGIEGTGRGLPIVKQFVEINGGEITVESEVGKGTTFTVRFPFSDPLSDIFSTPDSGAARDGSAKRETEASALFIKHWETLLTTPLPEEKTALFDLRESIYAMERGISGFLGGQFIEHWDDPNPIQASKDAVMFEAYGRKLKSRIQEIDQRLGLEITLRVDETYVKATVRGHELFLEAPLPEDPYALEAIPMLLIDAMAELNQIVGDVIRSEWSTADNARIKERLAELSEGADFKGISHRLNEKLTLVDKMLEQKKGAQDGGRKLAASWGPMRVKITPETRARFDQLSAGIYPEEILKRLREERYDPIMVGYEHKDLSNLPEIQRLFQRIRRENPGRTLKVALEIVPPSRLQDIRELLSDGEVDARKTFRSKLHHSGALALWLLAEGFEVIPIEHPDVKSWIRDDKALRLYEDWNGESAKAEAHQESFTAIRRDIQGLSLMDKERPDILSVGVMHGLKYDLLLGRSGERSFYLLEKPLDETTWKTVLDIWERVHTDYRRPSQSPHETGDRIEAKDGGAARDREAENLAKTIEFEVSAFHETLKLGPLLGGRKEALRHRDRAREVGEDLLTLRRRGWVPHESIQGLVAGAFSKLGNAFSGGDLRRQTHFNEMERGRLEQAQAFYEAALSLRPAWDNYHRRRDEENLFWVGEALQRPLEFISRRFPFDNESAEDGGKKRDAQTSISDSILGGMERGLYFLQGLNQKVNPTAAREVRKEIREMIRWFAKTKRDIEAKGLQAVLRDSSLSLKRRKNFLKQVKLFEDTASRLLGQKVAVDRNRLFLLPNDSPWFRYFWGYQEVAFYVSHPTEKGFIVIVDQNFIEKQLKQKLHLRKKSALTAAKRQILFHELWHLAGIKPRQSVLGVFVTEGVADYLTSVTLRMTSKSSDDQLLPHEPNLAFVEEVSRHLGPNYITRARVLYHVYTTGDVQPLREVLGKKYKILEDVLRDVESLQGMWGNGEGLPSLVLEDPTFGEKEYQALHVIFGMVQRTGQRINEAFTQKTDPFDKISPQLFTSPKGPLKLFRFFFSDGLKPERVMHLTKELARGKKTRGEIREVLLKLTDRATRRTVKAYTAFESTHARDGGAHYLDLPEARHEEIHHPSLELVPLLSP